MGIVQSAVREKTCSQKKEAVCAGLLKNSLALQTQSLRESTFLVFEDEE